MDTPHFINNLPRLHVGRANSCELIGSPMFKWWVPGIMTVCSRNAHHTSVFKCEVEFTAMSRSAYGTTTSKGRRPQQLTIAVSSLKIRLHCIAGLRAYQARRPKPTTGVHTTPSNLHHYNFHESLFLHSSSALMFFAPCTVILLYN